jgi:hypothetical protein
MVGLPRHGHGRPLGDAQMHPELISSPPVGRGCGLTMAFALTRAVEVKSPR